MQICVVGTGYVGLVVGACLADQGFSVTCADRDADKIDALNQGIVPIYEPGLEDILRRVAREQRIRFSTDTPSAIAAADVVFIAVGTPSAADGSADLSAVLGVAGEIGDHITNDSRKRETQNPPTQDKSQDESFVVETCFQDCTHVLHRAASDIQVSSPIVYGLE